MLSFNVQINTPTIFFHLKVIVILLDKLNEMSATFIFEWPFHISFIHVHAMSNYLFSFGYFG